MNNLIFSCIDDLSQPGTPVCSTNYGNAKKILLSKSIITAAGNVPTAFELGTAYNAGGISLISGFTNFSKTQIDSIDIEDPSTGKVKIYDKRYRIQGKIRRLDNQILRMTEKLNYYRSLYLYYLTTLNYCFGPYKVIPYFSLIKQSAVPIFIEFNFDYIDLGIDYKNQDDDYENIPGYPTYLITEDEKFITTEDGKYIIL